MSLNLRGIGWHFDLGTDVLDPRVPDLVYSESEGASSSVWNSGLKEDDSCSISKPNSGLRRHFLSKFRPLKCLEWQNLLISLNVSLFLPRNSSQIYREPHTTWCCVEQLHLAPCSLMPCELLWLLAPRVLSDFD